MKEYDEGYQAFWDDKEITDCPYDESDKERYMAWRGAWFDAYTETK